MDAIFNVTVTHTSAIGGCTCAQHVAITGAKTVNLKEKIVKKILSHVISTQNRITSFNPEELRTNDLNFFFLWETGVNRHKTCINIFAHITCTMCLWWSRLRNIKRTMQLGFYSFKWMEWETPSQTLVETKFL